MNSTLIGCFAIFVWGASIPIVRIVTDQIGGLPYIGIEFGTIGLATLVFMKLAKKSFPSKELIKSPLVWLRGSLFVLHESLLYIAVYIVQREYVPLVILLNYLWPTCIIICSVLIAGVAITRWWAFILGTILVLYSLSLELLGSSSMQSKMFENSTDRLAYIIVTIGAVCWGMYCAISKRVGDKTGGGSVIPFFQLVLGLALPISFIPQFSVPWNLDMQGFFILTIFIIGNFAAYQAWDHGMRRGNVVIISLIADFIPWISLFSASIFLGLKIESSTIISAIILVIGGMITRYGTLSRTIKHTTAASP